VPCHDQGLDRDRDQERLPKGRLFRLRRVTWKQSKVAPSPSNQGCLLLVWPLLRRGSLTPTTLRGPAPNGHPCPDGALAASMRLDPLCVVYVQPAPKSRLAVFGLFAYEDQEQKQIKSKSRSRAFGLKPVPRSRSALPLIVPTLCVGMHPWTLCVPRRLMGGLLDARGVCGTGFSGEGVGRSDIPLTDHFSSSSRSRKRSSAGSMSSRSMAPKPSIRPSRAAASL
jgi:hypothetical protein